MTAQTTTILRDQSYISGLEDFCRALVTPRTVLVELGCFGGESTAIFARSAGKVFAVDPWDDDYRSSIAAGCADPWILDYLEQTPVPPMGEIEALFDARTAPFANVVKHKETAEAALRRFADSSVDLVYIDSIHTYEAVCRQIDQWRPKVRPGGFLAGHDFDPVGWPGVVRAVEEKLGTPPHLFEDTSWAHPV
jgi:SAM-dependent methyltransferase